VIGEEFIEEATLANIEEHDMPSKFVTGQTSALVISGPVGVGKSYLASALLNNALQSNCKDAVFASASRMIQEFRDSEIDFTAGPRDPTLRKTVENAGLLVLDDLGTEKSSEWTESLLNGIVSYRYGKNLPIIVTANCKLEELRDRISNRTLDRLLGMAGGSAKLMKGPSRRLAKR